MPPIYTTEELYNLIKLVSQLIMLIMSTSVGTFTRELLFPKVNTVRENIGLSLVSGFIAFGILTRYSEVAKIGRAHV